MNAHCIPVFEGGALRRIERIEKLLEVAALDGLLDGIVPAQRLQLLEFPDVDARRKRRENSVIKSRLVDRCRPQQILEPTLPRAGANGGRYERVRRGREIPRHLHREKS